MKKLLLVLVCTLSCYAYSQAVANPAPNITQCGNEVFNLTAQTPIILGNQPLGQFTVNYFLSLADATANVNPIANPGTFISPASAIVYARVDNTSDATFATTSFQVSWQTPVQVPDVPDVSACGSYTLPPAPGISYTSDFAGTVAAPAVITTTATIYRHLDNTPCSIPSSFVVTINPIPQAWEMADIQVCDFWTPPVLPAGQTFHTEPGGSVGTTIAPGTVITTTSVIYIFAESGSTPNCTDESSFVVTVLQTPIAEELPDVNTCGSYTLPVLNGLSAYYTGTMGTGTQLFPGTEITTSQTIYIFAQAGGGCFSETSFQVTISDPSVATNLPDIYACSSYTLPALEPGSNYYTGPGGTGDLVAAGTVISAPTDLYIYAQSGQCWFTSVFHINIGSPEIAAQQPLTACDSNQDGFATFNLTATASTITNNMGNVMIGFYETMTDAMTGNNPISFDYINIVANTQTLFYRLTIINDSDCYSLGQLELQTVPCPSIAGVVRFDAANDGCDEFDAPIANAQVSLVVGNYLIYAYTNASGEYSFDDLAFGNYYVSMANTTLGNSVGSTSVAVAANQDYTANFCVVPAVPTNDIITYLWPITNARPGFPAGYLLQVYNNGNTVQSGNLSLDFDDAKLNFGSASPAAAGQTPGQVQFAFAGLQPAATQAYYIWFTVETPPTANSGEVISFTATADSALADATPDNNTATVSQMLVNSYDPNDKTVLQEAFLSDDTQNYLRYIVRFQNTGTAEAVNVRITDQLDEHLDWSTFRPVSASHDFSAERDQNGQVTFSFGNINLPDSTTNEPASHGFVTYEIKLKPGLTVNDDVYNTANIYFDFNAPIVTNTVMTDLVNLLGVADHDAPTFVVYPNPAHRTVNISTARNEDFTATVYDLNGKNVLEAAGQGQVLFDVSSLQQGMYFVKVVTQNGSETKKLLVR